MNNCLITRLKTTINDDSLEKIGVLRFSFDVSDTTKTINIHAIEKDTCLMSIISGPDGAQFIRKNNSAILGTSFYLENNLDLYVVTLSLG